MKPSEVEPTLKDIAVATKFVTEYNHGDDATKVETLAHLIAGGRGFERKQIVDWLRDHAVGSPNGLAAHFAKEIEIGSHRPDGSSLTSGPGEPK